MTQAYRDDPGLINVWLNLCKILIGLVVVYQIVLSNQLGLDNLITGYDVLVPEEQIKELNPENPYFNLSFLPISMVRNYDYCELEITEISAMPTGGGVPEKIFSEGSSLREEIFKQKVPFTRNPSMLNGNSRDNRPQNLSQVSFNLSNFLNGRAPFPADYNVEYRFNFLKDDKKIVSVDDVEPTTFTLNAPAQSLLNPGYIFLREGDSAEIPRSIEKGVFLPRVVITRSRDEEVSRAFSEITPLIGIQEIDGSPRFIVSGFPGEYRGRSTLFYEMSGDYYPAKSGMEGLVIVENASGLSGYIEEGKIAPYERFDLNLEFLISENLRPRTSVYNSQGSNTVWLYSNRDMWSNSAADSALFRSEPDLENLTGKQFFRLSPYIVDPDGTYGSKSLNIRVQEQYRQDYQAYWHEGNREWRLYLLSPLRRSLSTTLSGGQVLNVAQLSITASDNCSSTTIDIIIS